jgi:hypothetical protein
MARAQTKIAGQSFAMVSVPPETIAVPCARLSVGALPRSEGAGFASVLPGLCTALVGAGLVAGAAGDDAAADFKDAAGTGWLARVAVPGVPV